MHSLLGISAIVSSSYAAAADKVFSLSYPDSVKVTKFSNWLNTFDIEIHDNSHFGHIFTNWLNFGTSIVKKVLDKENIKYALITGKTTATERVEIINKFNNDEYDTLIITRAGGEGINLKGVRNVIVLDPTWNHASIYQIIGRGIRFSSHAHLPEEDRFVNVYLLVSTTPHGIDGETGDEKLYKIMETKREINKKVIDNLKKYCISSEKM